MAFLLLFASELTFYLLILQTGIIEVHHSDLHEVWMVPVGGVIGIISSIYAYKERGWLMPVLLLMQLALSLDYIRYDGLEMFLMGLVSGLTAPLLIARINTFLPVMFALGLSYIVGTYNFDLPVDDRTGLAVVLSLIAFVASLFAQMGQEKTLKERYSVSTVATIFFWLILDAALFETLSRDPQMRIWGEASFTYVIIAFHLVGIAAAYRLRAWRHNNLAIFVLFAVTYIIYTLKFQITLSVIYPFVISFYNVIILERFRKIHYPNLAFAALSLWIASGFGLMIALAKSFSVAWAVLLLLGLICFTQRKEHA